jgi:diacylglycerol kinase family enzyme
MARNYLFVFNPIAGKGNTKHFFKAHQNWLEQTKHNSVVYKTTHQKVAA